ncbi:MAG: ATP-binding protein [Planctomycetota bacterium]
MKTRTILLIASAVFLAGAAGVGFTVKTLREESSRTLQERMDLIAGQTALRLEEFLDSRLLAVQTLQQGMQLGIFEDSHRFSAASEALQSEFRGFQALNWIDQDYFLRWVVPEEENRGALGRNVLESPLARLAVLKAESSKEPEFSKPLDLFQGGRGIASYFPVYEDGVDGPSLRGFVNGVFRIAPMVEEAFEERLQKDFALELRTMDGELLYVSEEHNPDHGKHPDTAHAHHHGQGVVGALHQDWSLTLFPKADALAELGAEEHFSFLIGGLALFLALGIGVGMYLWLRREEERRRAERLQLQERVAQSRKLEAVGQLAGGIAHDFNNLLTAITGSASLASFDVEAESPASKHLERILQACRRAAEMTARLLTFSRSSAAELGSCSVSSELHALQDLLQPLIREDIQLDYRIEDGLENVPLAASELGQVVFNLVANAIDAMPRGGALQVHAEACATDHEDRPGPWVMIQVRDHGAGMSDEIIERIFDPFYTTKRAGEGTGLGLSTVYGIVRRAKGSVTVASQLGAGTTMRVFLPQIEHLPPVDTEMLPSHAPGAQSGRILVVEDEAKVREVAVEMLEEVGYRVTYTSNGAAALDLMEQDSDFDLVFSDVVMPRLGGVELAHSLRERGFEGSILLSSGYATGLSREELDSLNAAFLAKPYSHARLLEAIAHGVQSSS